MNLSCPVCQKSWPLQSELLYICPECHGNLEVLYDYDQLRLTVYRESVRSSPFDLWRYLPLYPIQEPAPGPQLGGTPCTPAPRLARQLGLSEVWLKNDSLLPSASFKCRASAVALRWAQENGYQTIAAASTGNAGAAAALWSAVLEQPAYIFIPHTAPAGKVAQLMAFGANVIMVNGTYDQAFDLCMEASKKYGWFNRNTGYNPITREGKKSVSFEIADQFDWEPPDVVVVSVGDGNIISGVGKGFREMVQLGWIHQSPRLLGVQAEGSDAITTAWESKQPIQPVSADTVADSISVDLPRDGDAAVRAIRDSNGWAVRVTDEAILSAIPELAQTTGIFAEPAAAAALAGVHKALQQGLLKPEWRVLLIITGHGLKDIKAVQQSVGEPIRIDPDLNALEKAIL